MSVTNRHLMKVWLVPDIFVSELEPLGTIVFSKWFLREDYVPVPW